jgi:hypothetical protein
MGNTTGDRGILRVNEPMIDASSSHAERNEMRPVIGNPVARLNVSFSSVVGTSQSLTGYKRASDVSTFPIASRPRIESHASEDVGNALFSDGNDFVPDATPTHFEQSSALEQFVHRGSISSAIDSTINQRSERPPQPLRRKSLLVTPLSELGPVTSSQIPSNVTVQAARNRTVVAFPDYVPPDSASRWNSTTWKDVGTIVRSIEWKDLTTESSLSGGFLHAHNSINENHSNRISFYYREDIKSDKSIEYQFDLRVGGLSITNSVFVTINSAEAGEVSRALIGTFQLKSCEHSGKVLDGIVWFMKSGRHARIDMPITSVAYIGYTVDEMSTKYFRFLKKKDYFTYNSNFQLYLHKFG